MICFPQQTWTLQLVSYRLKQNDVGLHTLKTSQQQKKLPTLMSFNEWLENEAVVYERLLSEKRSFLKDTQQFKKTLKVSKNENNIALGAVEATENAEKVCVHCKKEHQLWNFQEFKDLSLEDKFFFVKSEKLCFGCLGGNHQIKDCRIKLCGIGGCKRKHNRLLHPKVKADQNSTNTIANGNIVRQKELLQVAAVRLFGLNGRIEDTWALCDTGSIQTWVDDTLIDILGVEGQDITLEVSGIHGTRSMKTRSVPIKVGRKNSSVEDAALVIANCHKSLDIGNSLYNLTTLKDAYPYLRCIQQNRKDVGSVKVILGRDCYFLIRPLEYKKMDSTSLGQLEPNSAGWFVVHYLQTKCVNARSFPRTFQIKSQG